MAPIQKKPNITPFLWFNNQAEEATRFYTAVFHKSRITHITRYSSVGQEVHGQQEGSVMTVDFELEGQPFIALNGGDAFSFTPAISFFITCENEEQVDAFWKRFLEGGQVLMDLDRYEWSGRYGWIQDRFGVSWQIGLGNPDEAGQKITPSLLFTGPAVGKAKEAIRKYTSVFPDSQTDILLQYGPGEQLPQGHVKYAEISLQGYRFMIMEGGQEHDFSFNEAISFLVRCKNQQEIDHFWDELSQGGDPQARQCGWLKDAFGISWQIVPDILNDLLNDPDAQKANRVMEAMLKMKKLEIPGLLRAYEQRVDAPNT